MRECCMNVCTCLFVLYPCVFVHATNYTQCTAVLSALCSTSLHLCSQSCLYLPLPQLLPIWMLPDPTAHLRKLYPILQVDNNTTVFKVLVHVISAHLLYTCMYNYIINTTMHMQIVFYVHSIDTKHFASSVHYIHSQRASHYVMYGKILYILGHFLV